MLPCVSYLFINWHWQLLLHWIPLYLSLREEKRAERKTTNVVEWKYIYISGSIFVSTHTWALSTLSLLHVSLHKTYYAYYYVQNDVVFPRKLHYLNSFFNLLLWVQHLDLGLCVCVYIFISSYCVSVHISNICEQQQISYISLCCCERSLWPKVTKFVLRYPRCKQNKTSLLCRVNSGTFKVHGKTARFSFICLL